MRLGFHTLYSFPQDQRCHHRTWRRRSEAWPNFSQRGFQWIRRSLVCLGIRCRRISWNFRKPRISVRMESAWPLNYASTWIWNPLPFGNPPYSANQAQFPNCIPGRARTKWIYSSSSAVRFLSRVHYLCWWRKVLPSPSTTLAALSLPEVAPVWTRATYRKSRTRISTPFLGYGCKMWSTGMGKAMLERASNHIRGWRHSTFG